MEGTKPDWNAAVLLDHLPDERDRTRLAAAAGLALLLAGLLVALGLGIIVAAVAVATLAFWGGRRAHGALRGRRPALRRRARRTLTAAQSLGARAKPAASIGVDRIRATTGTALAHGERGSAAAASAVRTAAGRARETAATHRPTLPAPRAPRAHELRREALRLNTAGSSYRRNGDAARAADTHLEALELVRAAADRLGEALTLNNLGLALGAAGDAEAAIGRFEDAHAIARELDAPQYDGLIAANLANAYRRSGHDAEATRLLQVALEKLPRDSGAYHRVEEQLTRAS